MYPRNAANRIETGGRFAACWAEAAETPWASSPLAIVCGRLPASPAIISEKKIPTDSTWAEFWNVWFMPPPAPRSPGGRLFMIAARFGEANIPIAIPFISSTSANTG